MTEKEKLEKAAAKVDALKAQREEIAATRTKEDAASLAADFVSNAQRADVRGFILSGHAVGDPLLQVVAAYVVSGDTRPFPEWAAEQGQAGFDLSEKQKTGMLAKLDSEIPAAEKDQLAAAKAVRLAELDEEFAALGGAA
jgi:hypothetical protein